MESTQGASSDQSSSSNNNNTPATNATTKQTTPETKTNILCQTKSVSTIHTQQPVAMLHFRELENQLKAERAQAQRSFEKGPKMIPIDMVPMQRASSDEDSLDDAKNYRLPIGIRKMNEKARAEKLARQQELIRLSQERLRNMPAGVKHFNKLDSDEKKKQQASSASSGEVSKGREAPPPPASVATEYFRKKEMERIQAKLNETSITENDEPGSSSDALSADHLDG